MTEIKVRTATASDIKKIRELMIQLYDYFGTEFNEQRFEWGIKKRLKDRLQREGILIANKITDVGKSIVVGVLIAEILVNPLGEGEGHITAIVIDDEHRNEGVGHVLIEEAIKHLEKMGAEVIKLDLEEDFMKMLPYFRELGFESKYRVLEYVPENK
ncbi:MAG: GNAT family N-acetyltransferase [Candidatus Lokiarchaeota archaeon]|nr:GNAT family N-acetyltransferase [Candidatus Lokiarchaeota archaeon]